LKVYRRCEKQCYKCAQCLEFQKVVEEIDLERESPQQRKERADKERNKDAPNR
jgi:hypothetical protein